MPSCILSPLVFYYFVFRYSWFQRRRWLPTPVLLPGKPHGWRSLVGCSPWGREESDTTERLHFPFSLSCIGEGNGNPLQCSCLENPRDGGAWWAAVYGVAQSRTGLKRLSSSSIVDLQCVNFWCAAKWFSYIYIHMYILFQILFRYGLLEDIEYCSLQDTIKLCCLSILYIMVCIC